MLGGGGVFSFFARQCGQKILLQTHGSKRTGCLFKKTVIITAALP